jgi:DNA-directed RNA polymerase specialized sigma24 family protein
VRSRLHRARLQLKEQLDLVLNAKEKGLGETTKRV